MDSCVLSVASMKIPETSANVGAYYGNEENGQWQPNGVIIDSGVGGGVVGSGDGLRPQPGYPVHMPRPHIPGYVMAGAYYATGTGFPPAAPDDFADYMWMENEEEFDKQVMQQLEEEALMEQCIEAMLEDEQRERQRPVNGHARFPTTSNGTPSISLEEAVSRSTLNPLAAEFVPTGVRPASGDEVKKDTESSSTQETQKEASCEPVVESKQAPEVKTEEAQPPSEPPEVSAAHALPVSEKRKEKDVKKDVKPKADTAKKPLKPEAKAKVKPIAVKSETKVQPKKKELKAVKSEEKIEREEVIVPEVPKLQPQATEEAPAGPKPINYAAAAKANKPKKPTSPPVPAAEKTPPPPQPAVKPKEKKPTAQRKNSAK